MKHHHRGKEPPGKNEVAINEGGSSVGTGMSAWDV